MKLIFNALTAWIVTSMSHNFMSPIFETKEAALAYSKDKGIEAVVSEPKTRKANIRQRGYGENFATDRKGAWTH